MNYDDIIDIEYPIRLQHPRMDKCRRAAIFAPFAALLGYDDTLKEVSRLTEAKRIIDTDLKNIIDIKLNNIYQNIKNHPYVSITYFVKDNYKEGGRYLTINDMVRKIDRYNKQIVMNDQRIIRMEDIISISE